MKVIVLGGGISPERDVSLRSAKAVAEAAEKAGFEIVELDPREGLKELGDYKDAIVFPILHGAGGEDGSIQKELEAHGLPFLGADSQSSMNCFDKWKTREILTSAKIEMPKAERVTKVSYSDSVLSARPHVLKVVHGGSSIGTLIVRNPTKVDQKMTDELFELENDAVLEELVEGVEVTVPIFDKTALPALEVVPPEGGEFDYENKYNGQSQELCPPPSLSKEQHEAAQRLSEKVHSTMNCRHLSRVDTIMRPDGSFVVLEINTIPGLTNQSLYPKSAQVAGMDMPALVKKFAELVKRDYNL